MAWMRGRALVALTKPKILMASVLTALATYVSIANSISLPKTLALLGASALAAGGSLAFNQWWERNSDPLMRRTRLRPLPCGHLSPTLALIWSAALFFSGCLWLLLAFGWLTATLGFITGFIYAALYTPLKSKTRWATEIGSISGALPPLLGAAAAGHFNAAPAWFLAGAILLWQLPHFYAIGWIHREDYRAAQLPLLPATDSNGQRTGTWAVGYAASLTLFLLILWCLGLIPDLGGAAALAASLWILIRAWKFRAAPDDKVAAARRLFRATLLSLPAILLLVL